MALNQSKYTDQVLSCLINERCKICVFEDPELALHFGPVVSDKSMKTIWFLRIYCRWRLSDSDRIIVARFDDAKLINQALGALKGATLAEIEHENISHDLKLVFDNNLSIQTFSDSVMYAQWEICGANGYQYGIGPDLSPYEQMNSESDNG